MMNWDNIELRRKVSELSGISEDEIRPYVTWERKDRLAVPEDVKVCVLPLKKYAALGNVRHSILIPSAALQGFMNITEPDEVKGGARRSGSSSGLLFYYIDAFRSIPGAQYWPNT